MLDIALDAALDTALDAATIGTSFILAGVVLTGYMSLMKLIFSECDREHMVRCRVEDEDILMDELDQDNVSDEDQDNVSDQDDVGLYDKYKNMCIEDKEWNK